MDGIPGPVTAAATRAFQTRRGLPPDGNPTPETQAALISALQTPDPWSHVRHFRRSEFRCRCGGKYCTGYPAEPDPTLVALADDLRTHFGAPAHISSGLRCEKHNAAVGGVANSRHLTGKAMDFFIEGITGPALLHRAQADPRTRYAYIIGSGPYIHMDVQ